MNYKKSLAKVESLRGGRAKLVLSPENRFSSCTEKGCNLCDKSPKERHLTVKNEQNLRVGDGVIVELVEVNEAISAALVFMVPLLITFATALLNSQVLKLSLDSGLSMTIIFVVFFLSLISTSLFEKVIYLKYPIEISPIECE